MDWFLTYLKPIITRWLRLSMEKRSATSWISKLRTTILDLKSSVLSRWCKSSKKSIKLSRQTTANSSLVSKHARNWSEHLSILNPTQHSRLKWLRWWKMFTTWSPTRRSSYQDRTSTIWLRFILSLRCGKKSTVCSLPLTKITVLRSVR